VLSVGSDRIDTERLGLCFELEVSTSASTLLLSSIDGARRQFVREGSDLLDRAVRSAQLLRRRLEAEVPELEVVSTEKLKAAGGVVSVDPTHPMIETRPVGLTGYQADDWIRDQRHVDGELVDHRRIMPLVTFAHGEAEIDWLVRALRDLVDAHDGSDDVPQLPATRQLRTEQAMLPRDAFFGPTETLEPREAVGRVSAEFVTPYPPGVPVIKLRRGAHRGDRHLPAGVRGGRRLRRRRERPDASETPRGHLARAAGEVAAPRVCRRLVLGYALTG